MKIFTMSKEALKVIVRKPIAKDKVTKADETSDKKVINGKETRKSEKPANYAVFISWNQDGQPSLKMKDKNIPCKCLSNPSFASLPAVRNLYIRKLLLQEFRTA